MVHKSRHLLRRFHRDEMRVRHHDVAAVVEVGGEVRRGKGRRHIHRPFRRHEARRADHRYRRVDPADLVVNVGIIESAAFVDRSLDFGRTRQNVAVTTGISGEFRGQFSAMSRGATPASMKILRRLQPNQSNTAIFKRGNETPKSLRTSFWYCFREMGVE